MFIFKVFVGYPRIDANMTVINMIQVLKRKIQTVNKYVKSSTWFKSQKKTKCFLKDFTLKDGREPEDETPTKDSEEESHRVKESSAIINEKRVLRKRRGKVGADKRAKCSSDIGR